MSNVDGPVVKMPPISKEEYVMVSKDAWAKIQTELEMFDWSKKVYEAREETMKKQDERLAMIEILVKALQMQMGKITFDSKVKKKMPVQLWYEDVLYVVEELREAIEG